MSTTHAFTERDAYRHQLPADERAREAIYWNLLLPEVKLGVSLYIYFKPTGEATEVMLAYGEDRAPILETVADVRAEGEDLDDLRVGPMRVRHPEAFRTWEVDYAGERVQLRYRYEAMTEPFSYHRNPGGSPVSFTDGDRVEQDGTVEGVLTFDGREIPFATTAHHDHSWGIRDWAAMMHYKWIAAQCGADLSIHACQIVWRGVSTVNGYVWRDGTHSPLVDVSWGGTYDADVLPATTELELRDEAGRTTRASGRWFAGTVFPIGGVELTENAMTFEIEGRKGVGINEMLWPEGYLAHMKRYYAHLAGT
jgi:hypothetical protein